MNNDRDLGLSNKDKEKLDMRDGKFKMMYYLCPCGKVVRWSYHGIYAHKKTKNHQKYIFLDHLKHGDPI